MRSWSAYTLFEGLQTARVDGVMSKASGYLGHALLILCLTDLPAAEGQPSLTGQASDRPVTEDDSDSTRIEELERRIEELASELEQSRSVEPAEPQADDGTGRPPSSDTGEGRVSIEELERRIEILAEELERLRSGESTARMSVEDARKIGLSPAASSTYAREGVSIAGYGEMLYENYANDSGKTNQFDYLRAILYLGYRFSDKFLFNSEIEVEHANEIFVEFAYIDYQAAQNFGFRAGLLLVPMGLVNEFHEPTVFIGAERPVTEQSIIPSTWREPGGGVYGGFDKFAFRAYVLSGFRGSKFSSSGLRGGRQKGSKSRSDNMAFVGRFDFTPISGVLLGGSMYTGGSGQGEVTADSVNYPVHTNIIDVHAQIQVRGFDFRTVYAQATLEDTPQLNQSLGLTGLNGVGEKMHGGYAQFGYDVLARVATSKGRLLRPYVRFEKVDTQAALAAGFTKNPSKNNTYTTFGIEFRPINNIVFKFDHMWVNNTVDSGVNQLNAYVGYIF